MTISINADDVEVVNIYRIMNGRSVIGIGTPFGFVIDNADIGYLERHLDRSSEAIKTILEQLTQSGKAL